MLTISEAQFLALELAARKRWRQTLISWLRKHAEPARSMSNDNLSAFVERQEARAASFGIERQSDIAKWCFMSVMTAERFDQDPQILALLRDPDRDSMTMRLDLLMTSYAAAALRRVKA